MPKPDWLDPSAIETAPIETLDAFFHSVDSEALFDHTDPSLFAEIRTVIRRVLVQLLVWNRPLLEASRSLAWPYEALRQRKQIFEDLTTGKKGAFPTHQASLFLALLPFPDQWHWLFKAEDDYGDDPEVTRFLSTEARKIEEKVKKKQQKRYKLHHFCQVLKKPRLPEEKGIIRIFALAYTFCRPQILKELSHRYFIYLEPTAGVFFRHTWWRYLTTAEDPCLLGAASEEDRRFLKSQKGILVTHMAHGDYLETDTPKDTDTHREKKFDIVFNGTYDEMDRKRHQFLLSLLSHPLLQDVTVLFMGRGNNDNVERFRQQVINKQMDRRVTVLSNLRRNLVPDYLAESRIGVHLALHENGPRCIYEFLRADIPCVISACTAGVNFDHINANTGMVVSDPDLPQAIATMLENRHQFSPRKWFLEQSGSRNSTAILNRRLQTIFHDLGYEWNADIVPLGSSGANRYVSSDDFNLFRPEYEALFNLLNQKGLLPAKIALD